MAQSNDSGSGLNYIEQAYRSLENKQLFQAAECLLMQFADQPDFRFSGPMKHWSQEYTMMSQYWLKGYPDPHRETMFNKLRIDLLEITDMYAAALWNSCDNKYLHDKGENLRKKATEWSWEMVRKRMEAYVVNLTMTTLEGDALDEVNPSERQWVMHEEHQKFREQAFDYILTDIHQLKQSDAGQLQEIIESPLIDSVDQQLLVSALTLSGLRLFDMRKFRLLAHVYLHSTVMEVKQRALVGWVLMLGWMRHNDYPEIGDIVSSLTGDEQTKTDLVNLQLQLLTTVDAESAGKNFSKTIKEEMPNLSSFSVEDIESTDDLDRIMSENDSILQQYAEAINLQKDMRQKGNDIYFDGFKNMKKFPFFNDVCNWFMPFITTHPALRSVNNRDMMRFFKVSGSLCDNDMYSLSIAMNSCVSQMPPAISEAMKQHTGDVKPTESPNEQIRKILYMRNYIESMYRFFRLFRYRDSFRPHRPFPDSSLAEVHQCEDIPELLFMANPVFSRKECVGMMLDTVRLLIRKKCYPLANDAFVRIPYDDKYLDNKVYITTLAKLTILGQPAAMLLGLNELDILRKASLMYPESKVICKALALLLQQTHHYEEAEKYFDRLAAHDKDAVDWPLEKARCLINRKEYTKALDTLFKIRYEHEDEQTVIPLIADCKIRLGERMEAFGFLQTAIDQGNADDTTKRIYIACACVNAIKGEQGIPMDKVLEITLEYLRSSYSSEELLDFDNFPEIMETDFIRYVREAMNFDDSQPTTSIEVFMCMLSNEVWNVLD